MSGVKIIVSLGRPVFETKVVYFNTDEELLAYINGVEDGLSYEGATFSDDIEELEEFLYEVSTEEEPETILERIKNELEK